MKKTALTKSYGNLKTKRLNTISHKQLTRNIIRKPE